MKNISDRHFSQFEDQTEFVLDKNSAACVIDSDGSMTLYFPEAKEGENVPEHVQALTAMSIYFAEHYDQVMEWFKKQTGQAN